MIPPCGQKSGSQANGEETYGLCANTHKVVAALKLFVTAKKPCDSGGPIELIYRDFPGNQLTAGRWIFPMPSCLYYLLLQNRSSYLYFVLRWERKFPDPSESIFQSEYSSRTKVKLVENGKLDSQLGFCCHCGQLYQAQTRLLGTFSSELNFVFLSYAGMSILWLIVMPHGDAGL